MLTKHKLRMRNLARLTLPNGTTKLARVDRSAKQFVITTDDAVPERFTVPVSEFQRKCFLSGDGIELRPVNEHTGYRLRMVVRKLDTLGVVKVPEVMFHD